MAKLFGGLQWVSAWRLRHLPRPPLPVDLLAEWRLGAHQLRLPFGFSVLHGLDEPRIPRTVSCSSRAAVRRPPREGDLTQIDPDLRMPYTHPVEPDLRTQDSVELVGACDLHRDAGPGHAEFSLDNLPVPPGAPRLNLRARRQLSVRGHHDGCGYHRHVPRPRPIAANEISARVPRTNERRPDARCKHEHRHLEPSPVLV